MTEPRTIDLIRLSPYLEGSHAGKQKVAQQVAHACETIGFLVITDHGVPQQLIDSTYGAARQFFDLPSEVKQEYISPRPDIFRGYSAVASKSLSGSLGKPTPGDLREIFTINRVHIPDEDYFHNPSVGTLFYPNIWPTIPSEFRSIWTAYYQAMETLASQLMRIFALALELPETFFDDKIDKHFSNFAASNYPAQIEEPLPGQVRASAHTDFGSLTIVYQDNALGGLQAWDGKHHNWIDVAPVPGSFVVNIGDLMAQWTNDRWVSTLHRVVNPPRNQDADHRRESLIFFHQPNYDALIECLPSCNSPANPAKYQPITSGEHLKSKMMKMRLKATV